MLPSRIERENGPSASPSIYAQGASRLTSPTLFAHECVASVHSSAGFVSSPPERRPIAENCPDHGVRAEETLPFLKLSEFITCDITLLFISRDQRDYNAKLYIVGVSEALLNLIFARGTRFNQNPNYRLDEKRRIRMDCIDCSGDSRI